jgi:signal peptidase I
MSPTIEVGNLIVVDEQPRDFTPTRTGEVVVFRGPASDGVRGSPQSTLVKQAEPWLPAGTQLGRAIKKQVIPAGRYFMLGDNRAISCDSHYWGTVPASHLPPERPRSSR